MFRTRIILWYTFRESIVQPIYSLLLGLGIAVLSVYGMLPFFTLGEDTKMYKSVGLDVVLLMVLLGVLFASSKSIYDEIEDRTMLTLMSKPVTRWQVMLGKYGGIVLAALLTTTILGLVLIVWTWLRIPTDYMLLRGPSVNDVESTHVWELRKMHIVGLFPSLLLLWLEVAVLASVGVALSTRFSLIVNLPAVILLYLAGNLARFILPISGGILQHKPPFVRDLAWTLSLLLPYLPTFDIRSTAVLGDIRLAFVTFQPDNRAVTPVALWAYVGVAALYAICYIAFALCAGMWSFQNRELGGGEE